MKMGGVPIVAKLVLDNHETEGISLYFFSSNVSKD